MKKKENTKSPHLFLKIVLALAACKFAISAYNFAQKNYITSECKNEFEKVDLIIKHGHKDEINEKGPNGETMLWWACYNNNFEIAKYLIEHGASKSINCTDDYGDSPLWWACFRNNLPLVRFLIKNGAKKSINLTGDCGLTPIDWACKNNYTELAQYLINNGAKINVKNNLPRNLTNSQIDSLPTFYCACCNGNLKIVTYLVKNNARKQANKPFDTDYLSSNDYLYKINPQNSYDNTKFLQANTEKFFISIYYACFENNINLINFLLFGPDKSFTSTEQEYISNSNKILLPALYFASISQNPRIIKYLIENYLN